MSPFLVMLCFLTSVLMSSQVENATPEYKRSAPMSSNKWSAPLLEAAMECNFEKAKDLLAGGAPVDLSIEDGLTAFHLAAISKCTDIIGALLHNGANVNARTANGSTVLHLIAANGNLLAARHVISAQNAKINVRDDNTETPLEISERLGYEDLTVLLKQKVSEIDSDLIAAAKDGDRTKITSLLARGADVDANDTVGESPLVKAVRRGDMELMHYLIKKGANVDGQSANGWTALHWAVDEGNRTIVEALIEHHNANLNLLGSDSTPLHIAVSTGNDELVEYLLQRGARIDLPSKDGLTALHLAAINNHQGIMTTILKTGADINERTRDGSTALHLSAARGIDQMVNYIVNRNDVILNVKNNKLASPLILAERGGHSKIFELLNHTGYFHIKDFFELLSGGNNEEVKSMILAGGDVEWRDKYGWTPLMYAVYYSHEGIVKYLMDYSASTSVKDVDGRTALRVAAFKGKINIVSYLIDNGADMNAEDRWGQTPLLAAATHNNNIEVVKSLTERGANVNATDHDGRSPLIIATANGCGSVVDYLCTNGADINKKDKLGETALHKSVHHDNVDIMNYLINRKADVCAQTLTGWNIVHLAVARGNARVIEHLVEPKHNITLMECPDSSSSIKQRLVNVPDNYGLTALLQAASLNYREQIIGLLLQGGADVNARCENGSTILNLMTASSDMSSVKVILRNSRGLEVDLPDNYGITPLHHAAIDLNKNMMEILLLAGADINARMKNGSTALHIASANGNLQMVKYILDRRNTNVSIEDSNMETALQLAKRGDHPEVIKLLKERISDSTYDSKTEESRFTDENGQSRLMVAAAKGWLFMVEHLCNSGADVNEKDVAGETALHKAVQHGYADIMSYLILRGADVCAQSFRGLTILHIAVSLDNVGIVKQLVGLKVECPFFPGHTIGNINESTKPLIDVPEKDGLTPLHVAILLGDGRILEPILYGGADINARMKDGSTALHLAVADDNWDVVKFMIDTGKADLTAINSDMETPETLAETGNRRELMKFLTEKTAEEYMSIVLERGHFRA